MYRKEGGRVVGFTWWRVAAAAVLLGFGLWTGVTVYKNNYTLKTDAAELANSNSNQKQQQNSDPVTTATQEKTTSNNIAATAGPDKQQAQAPSSENIKTSTEKKDDQNIVTSTNEVAVQNGRNKKPDNNLPKPSLQNINSNGSNENIIATVLPSNNNSSRVSGNNDAVVKITPRENRTVIENLNSKTDPDNITALQVVNTNKTADGEDNNRYLNVDDDKQKRTALGGFIRKAKRVLERNTNVKTGDGIKIAGFEIALK